MVAKKGHRASTSLVRALVLLGLVATIGASAAAPADAVGFNYSGTATGVAARIVFSATGAPVAESPLDIGGPIAQVRLDSVGRSEALAAFPYPGELVLSAPGVVAGSAPDAPTAPPYPFAARAEQPLTPEARAGDERNALEAHAQLDRATATASADSVGSGAAIASVAASASVVAEDDIVTAASESMAESVVVGPVRIATVRATATVVLGADGVVSRESTLAAEGASVAGIAVAFTRTGVEVQGSALPLEQAAVETALRDAGLQVRFLAEEQTEDGVISAGVEIVRSQQFASFGDGSMRLVLGQAIAAGTVGGQAPVVPPPASLGDTVLPQAAPTPGRGPGTPPQAPTVVPAAPPPATAVGGGAPAVTRLASALELFDVNRFYPVLFLGAAALLVTSPVSGRQLRTEKVRDRWTR